MRIVLRVVIGLVLLLLLGIGLVWIFQGRVIRAAIQSGGTWATGVETRVDDVSAGLLGGQLEIDGLQLANPPGFSNEPFFALRTAKADWETRSLFGDAVHVRELTLDGLALRIERNASGTNYGQILDHMRAGKSADEKPPADASASKRALVVDRIVLKDLTAELVLTDLPIATGPLRVTVPRIEIQDFRSDGPTREVVGQLLEAVVQAALDASLKAGKGIFPDDLTRDLEGRLGSAKAALKNALDGDVQGTIEDAGKALDGLKGVFQGKKKP